MTQEELNGLLQEMRDTLQKLGIPLSQRIMPAVQVNARARRRLGCCYYRPTENAYLIEVSASLLDRPEKLRETLAHELLHTCPGCRNHGEKWKAWADKVNSALGFSVQRLAPLEEGEGAPLRQDPVKYILQCQKCGKLIRRRRMCKVVKAPWRYRCTCGGKLKRVL